MKHYFPPVDKNYRYLQTNRSDVLGSLWSSFNIDLQSNPGRLRLSQKLVTNTTSSDDADLGLPCAFEYFDDRWWAICGTRVFKNSSDAITGSFSEDASTGAQTDYTPRESDLKVFNDRLWSTTTDNLYSKAQGSGTGDWTSRDALGGGIHQMNYFKKHNRLYYIDNSDTISSIGTADDVKNSVGDYFIDLGLPNSKEITCIDSNSDSMWIGTRSTSNSAIGLGTEGSICQWDGISSQIIREFKINAAGVMAICIVDDIPYAIDSEGRILQFTGYSFKEIGRLPVSRVLLTGATVTGSDLFFVHYNGMIPTKNNTILIMVDNTNSDNGETINENLPSGIWEIDLNNGNVTHRYSLTLKSRTGSDVTDFGQNRILAAGAIKSNPFSSDSTAGRGTLLVGAGYYTDATTTKYGIFIDSPAEPASDVEGQKRGYIVTTWFESSDIVESWKEITAAFRLFLASTSKLIFKYRFSETTPVYATITWVDTTHFTTTTNISGYGPNATGFDGSIGGEVEILQGTGSGACVHITNISESGGTYTVTIDNAVTGVTTGTAKARFQKWIKILPEITGQVLPYGRVSIDKKNTVVEIKMVMEFTGNDEFNKFILNSENHINFTNG